MGESANNRQFSRAGQSEQRSPVVNDPEQAVRPLVAFLLGVLLQILQEPSAQRVRSPISNRLSAPALLTSHSGLTPLLTANSGNGHRTEVNNQDEGQGDGEAGSAWQGNTGTESGKRDKRGRQRRFFDQLELPRLSVLRQSSQSSQSRTPTEAGHDSSEGARSESLPRRYSAPSPRLAYEQPSVNPDQREESSLSLPSSPTNDEPLDDYLFRAFMKWMRRRRESRHVSATPVRERSLRRSSSTSAYSTEKQRGSGIRTPSTARYFGSEHTLEAPPRDYSRNPVRAGLTTERRSERAVESSSDSDTPVPPMFGDYAFRNNVHGKHSMQHGHRVHPKDGRPRFLRWSVSAPSSSRRSHGGIPTPEDDWPSSSDEEPPSLMPRFPSGQRASHIRSSTPHPRGGGLDHSTHHIGPDRFSHPLSSAFQQSDEHGKRSQRLRAPDDYTRKHPGGVNPVQMTFQFYNQSSSGPIETGSSCTLLPPGAQGGVVPKRPLSSVPVSEGSSLSKGSRRILRRELPQYSNVSPSLRSTPRMPVQESGIFGTENDVRTQVHSVSPEFASPQPEDPASKRVGGHSSVRPASLFETGGPSATRPRRTSYSAPNVGTRQAYAPSGTTASTNATAFRSRIPVLEKNRSEPQKRMCTLLLDSAPHTLRSQLSLPSFAEGWRLELSKSLADATAASENVQSRAKESPDEQHPTGPGSVARHAYTRETLHSRPPLPPHRPRRSVPGDSLSNVHQLHSNNGGSYPASSQQPVTTSRPTGRPSSPRENSWPKDTSLRTVAVSRPRSSSDSPVEDEYLS